MRDIHKIDILNERLKNISIIQECFQTYGLLSYVIDGALLGVARENSLIKWDWDVEIAMLDNQFDLLTLESAFSSLKRYGLELKSLNLRKFPKFNLFTESDKDFTYSIIFLRSRKNFFVRPRYRYPKEFFLNEPLTDSRSGFKLLLPHKYYAFLDFVYGSKWSQPVQSDSVRDYLSKSVFRWGSFDWLHRISVKILANFRHLKRFIFSEFINSREPILKFILSQHTKPVCNLIEIGSSDGSETVSFLRYKLHRKSTIYEPRASAISKISTRFRFRLLKRRASLQQYLVVANERDSQNFVNLKKGNLSHIQLSKTNEKLQKKTNSNYITFQEVLAKHLFKPTLIKMDLEGYEFELLQTLAENLTLEKSVSFIIELHQKEYNLDRVKMIVNAMFQSGFKIECVETATNPKPMLLNDILYPMPLFVSSRRALYCVKHQEISPDKLIELIFGQNFVCNPKTSEFGYRLVRTVVISKDIKFMMRESRSIRSFAWKKYYKI